MSEHDDKRDWQEDEMDEEELPPRPRNRLLAPLPVFLVAVLIAAAGFLAGVLVQKGSEGASAGGLPGGGELPSFAAGDGEGDVAARMAGAFPGGASDAAVTGTVASVNGRTIYVKDADGNTVAVKAGDGSTITRDANTGVKKVRPGDSVVVQGSTKGSTVRASSISATEVGVESDLPSVGAGASEDAGDSVESLFGK